MLLSPNTLLKGGEYKIIKVLGQGGFGITYLAMQTGLDRKVAIKEFFMKDYCERDKATSHVTLGTEGSSELVRKCREKFLKEARNIAKLKHPSIVRIIDVFEENGTAYYVMEYVEGTSLDKYIEANHSLSEKESLECIEKIAHALKAMHDARMLHLDLKPLNIMRKDDGHIILIDFGLSKHFSEEGDPESSTAIGMGTMGYAPLEQASYKPGAGFPATLDIYALGATLYKCLTGKTPPPTSTILNDGSRFRTVYKIQPDYTMKKVISMSFSEWEEARMYT